MRCGRTGCWRTRLKPFPKSVCPELVEGQSFSSALQRKNGASTSSARTVRGRAMFAPLTKPDLGKTWEDARVYLRPTCFVDRPHELDDNRSEEHTSELQSLMRISYAVFCLKKKQ